VVLREGLWLGKMRGQSGERKDWVRQFISFLIVLYLDILLSPRN
jgi:hypothetical protein